MRVSTRDLTSRLDCRVSEARLIQPWQLKAAAPYTKSGEVSIGRIASSKKYSKWVSLPQIKKYSK